MNLSILELLGVILGSGGVGAFVLKILNLKSDKRKNVAEASIAEVSVDSKKLENLEKTIELQQRNYDHLNAMFSELQEQYGHILKEHIQVNEAMVAMQSDMQAMRLELETTTKRWESANAIRCEDLTCPKRIPPLKSKVQ